MPDIFDVQPRDKFMALLTGANGSGKSIAIASWLKKGSVYFFDFDGRMASVANYYKKRGLTPGQLSYDTYGPKNLYDALTKLDRFIDNCPHAAIALDSFTAATVTAVMFSLSRRASKGGNFIPASSKGDMIVPDFDEYKGETVCITQMLDLCKAIAAKGIAVLWTAHPVVSVKIEKGEGGSKDKYSKQTRYAAYGSKTDSLIPIYFNEIYHFTTEYDFNKEANIRWCFTGNYGEVTAKTAFDLPIKFDWTNANFYETLFALVDKGQNENAQTEEGDKNAEVKPPVDSFRIF